MMNTRNIVAELRRDMTVVWHAAIAFVLIGFVSLALASAIIDLLALRH